MSEEAIDKITPQKAHDMLERFGTLSGTKPKLKTPDTYKDKKRKKKKSLKTKRSKEWKKIFRPQGHEPTSRDVVAKVVDMQMPNTPLPKHVEKAAKIDL